MNLTGGHEINKPERSLLVLFLVEIASLPLHRLTSKNRNISEIPIAVYKNLSQLSAAPIVLVTNGGANWHEGDGATHAIYALTGTPVYCATSIHYTRG